MYPSGTTIGQSTIKMMASTCARGRTAVIAEVIVTAFAHNS